MTMGEVENTSGKHRSPGDRAHDSRLLTVKEAAAYLNLTPKTVRKYVSEGRIPHIRLSRKIRRFRKSALDKWLKKQECSGRTRQPIHHPGHA